MKPIGLIDTGLDAVGDITAVMNRATYYAYFLELSINVNADGEIVGRLPNLTRPDILGIPVVQMAFRGKGRFDGKPTKPEAFSLITITPAV